MQIDHLVSQLLLHFQAPQKSERWSMYRLITPVIDFANASRGLTVFFEFNQTSDHGRSQSVDIALLDGDKPLVLVEAKRAGRTISSDQIDKYLQNNERGLVSDGFHWILCRNRESSRLLVYDGFQVNRDALGKLVAFIARGEVAGMTWTEHTVLAETAVQPKRPKKAQTAIRASNPVVPTSDIAQLTEMVRQLPPGSVIQSALLAAILSRLQDIGGIPAGLSWEVRSSRISVFDQNARGRGASNRVARLLLGVINPDILVLNAVVDGFPTLSAIAKPTPHDKHPGMRRFRLGDENQATRFGIALVDALARRPKH